MFEIVTMIVDLGSYGDRELVFTVPLFVEKYSVYLYIASVVACSNGKFHKAYVLTCKLYNNYESCIIIPGKKNITTNATHSAHQFV